MKIDKIKLKELLKDISTKSGCPVMLGTSIPAMNCGDFFKCSECWLEYLRKERR